MSYVKEDESRSKLPAFICKRDVAQKSDANIVRFTQAQIAMAYELAAMADNAYFSKEVFVTFRKHIVTVKMHKVTGPVSAFVAQELNDFAELNGFEKQPFNSKNNSIQFTAKRIEK